jgi:hypothetical protein
MASLRKGGFEVKVSTFFALAFMSGVPAFAVQVVVGGTQSVEGFPFYGC